MTDLELAWAAGFFDGEGCIRIATATGQNLGTLAVEISNTDRRELDWLRSQWGGQVKPVTGRRLPNRKAAWMWRAWANKALAFLVAIEPHVRLTKNVERIVLAREFQEGAGAGRVNDEYRAWRFGCYLRMRDLNERGCPR